MTCAECPWKRRAKAGHGIWTCGSSDEDEGVLSGMVMLEGHLGEIKECQFRRPVRILIEEMRKLRKFSKTRNVDYNNLRARCDQLECRARELEKQLDATRKMSPDCRIDTCPKCDGTGSVADMSTGGLVGHECPDCKGRGYFTVFDGGSNIRTSRHDCLRCKGTGKVKS